MSCCGVFIKAYVEPEVRRECIKPWDRLKELEFSYCNGVHSFLLIHSASQRELQRIVRRSLRVLKVELTSKTTTWQTWGSTNMFGAKAAKGNRCLHFRTLITIFRPKRKNTPGVSLAEDQTLDSVKK